MHKSEKLNPEQKKRAVGAQIKEIAAKKKHAKTTPEKITKKYICQIWFFIKPVKIII
ncbi:hypothetical protein ACNIU4_26780 [Escherichia coli]